jgi:NADPH:quinone reductase-like Zn-dependent oxidoreductase
MIGSGRFRPLVDSVFPLAEANAAHERMESGDHAGKIILEVTRD